MKSPAFTIWTDFASRTYEDVHDRGSFYITDGYFKPAAFFSLRDNGGSLTMTLAGCGNRYEMERRAD